MSRFDKEADIEVRRWIDRSRRKKRERTRILTLRCLIFASIVLVTILAGLGLFIISGEIEANKTTVTGGGSTEYDTVCYLTAKYESSGHPESVGRDVGYQAYGEFQFHYKHELQDFLKWCVNKDPGFYARFRPYTLLPMTTVPGPVFRKMWKETAESGLGYFENDQEAFIVSETLQPALERLTKGTGYDFLNASDALKGCVLSIANRDGKYYENLEPFFGEAESGMTEEEIITRAYAAMIKKRPKEKRWVLEEADCLLLLSGKLDIYKVSKNDAGGIDWRWKRS